MEDKTLSAVTAVVKWFNPVKRYGFVHVPAQDRDAFLHASVLATDSRDWPRVDDRVLCTLEEDGRGLKVAQVLEVTRAEAEPKTHGAVRWFDPRKGYGFIMAENGEDTFVHRSALGGLNEQAMTPGQFVTFRARNGKKGRAAVDISLDGAPPAEVAARIAEQLALQRGKRTPE
jgi:CspA family cold shock protein